MLVESDHGYNDPPAAIPCRLEWVEHLIGQQLKCSIAEVGCLAWRNLGRIIRETGTQELFPQAYRRILEEVNLGTSSQEKLIP
jgi:hypothetical protein